jgi:hypothetical protein
MEEIQVEEEVKERLDLDKEKKLAELTKTAVSSVQHKLKTGSPMSDASIAKHQAAVDAVSAVLNDPSISDDEKAMAQHYMDQLNVVKDKIDNGGAPMPWMDAYEVTTTKMVTKQIPVPNGDPEPGTLAATVRKASRIKANLNPDTGQTSWDGVTRSSANGTEYEIDMGDGWKAVYRPYKENDPKTTEYSLRGQLEVHAPAGAGHGKDLVERLEQLHLMNKPMTAAEGEWTYLANNIKAQGLEGAPGMKAAMETAPGSPGSGNRAPAHGVPHGSRQRRPADGHEEDPPGGVPQGAADEGRGRPGRRREGLRIRQRCRTGGQPGLRADALDWREVADLVALRRDR